MDLEKLHGHSERFRRRFCRALLAYFGFVALGSVSLGFSVRHPALLPVALFGAFAAGFTLGIVFALVVAYDRDCDAWLLECEIERIRECQAEVERIRTRPTGAWASRPEDRPNVP